MSEENKNKGKSYKDSLYVSVVHSAIRCVVVAAIASLIYLTQSRVQVVDEQLLVLLVLFCGGYLITFVVYMLYGHRDNEG